MKLDGAIYVILGVLTAVTAMFSSDDAAKYVSPEMLFWVKGSVACASAGALALKMFRSTSFAEYQAKKNGNGKTGDTQLLTKGT